MHLRIAQRANVARLEPEGRRVWVVGGAAKAPKRPIAIVSEQVEVVVVCGNVQLAILVHILKEASMREPNAFRWRCVHHLAKCEAQPGRRRA